MKTRSRVIGVMLISLIMFGGGYFFNDIFSEEEVILEQSKDLNLLNVLNYQETDVEEIFENKTNDSQLTNIMMAKKNDTKQEEKQIKTFKKKPRESRKFRVGFKVNCKGQTGIIVGVPRGEDAPSKLILVEFDGKPKNVLRTDCEVTEQIEHKW